MENQLSFADCEYRQKRHQTRKEKFLARMEARVPWQRIEAVIEPYYPKPGNGRRPYPLITTRLFTSLSLDKPIPDHTTIMNFRHLLERHRLGRQIFEEVNRWLSPEIELSASLIRSHRVTEILTDISGEEQ